MDETYMDQKIGIQLINQLIVRGEKKVDFSIFAYMALKTSCK